MYALIAQIYWPAWLLVQRLTGSSLIGVSGGGLAVIASWMIVWKLEFGTFRFWSQS